MIVIILVDAVLFYHLLSFAQLKNALAMVLCESRLFLVFKLQGGSNNKTF